LSLYNPNILFTFLISEGGFETYGV